MGEGVLEGRVALGREYRILMVAALCLCCWKLRRPSGLLYQVHIMDRSERVGQNLAGLTGNDSIIN